MVARVWFSRSILTLSLASMAWCRPSLQRRPGIRRPVNSSTMMHLAFLDHVILVAVEQRVRLQRLFDVVLPLDGLHVPEVGQAEQPGGLVEAFVGERRRAGLLVDGVVAGVVLLARLLALDHLAADQLRDDAVDLEILVGRFLARAGDDERRPASSIRIESTSSTMA